VYDRIQRAAKLRTCKLAGTYAQMHVKVDTGEAQ
jgi:hypothetical protein